VRRVPLDINRAAFVFVAARCTRLCRSSSKHSTSATATFSPKNPSTTQSPGPSSSDQLR